MKIKHYLYNAFLIEEGDKKIAIDPGKNLYIFKHGSLIKKSQWNGITHILITHGDPDHYHFADVVSIASKTGAKIVCGEELAEDLVSKKIKDVHKLDVGETVGFKNMKVEGLKTIHGPLVVKLGAGLIYMSIMLREGDLGGQEVYIGPIRVQKIEKPMQVRNHGTVKFLFGLIRLEKDNVDFARGSIGFKITIGDKILVNLGDTVLLKEWKGLKPDVLMIPIGGVIRNTMNVKEALEAVKMIKPKMVIPMHYNCAFLWKRNLTPTDDEMFKMEVEKMGIKCQIMKSGDEIEL